MKSSNAPMISLEDARQLVTLLEQEKFDQASELIDASLMQNSAELFAEVGKLTRQLHDSLANFHLDPRIAGLANEVIPDAQMRLSYVIDETEKAANQTMDAVESSMPIAENLQTQISDVKQRWDKLMVRDMDVNEFKDTCHSVDQLLVLADKELNQLSGCLTEVLMAQGFQDLTGQVIRRVIELVTEVQDSLVSMLTMFGNMVPHENMPELDEVKSLTESYSGKAEGPIIDSAKRDDVVQDQDDVDDLLSSLGF